MYSDSGRSESILWRKPSRSLGNGECIEVGQSRDCIAVRDSKDPDREALTYSATAWRLFVLRLNR
jgi:Domain of unknown function (DUF397)